MINFNRATADDLGEVLQMMSEFYIIDSYPFDKSKNENNLRILINNKELGVLWLIQNESQTIGYICLTFGFSFEYGGRDAFVDEFFIKKEYRGKGLGRQTMDFVKAESKQLGVNAIHLEVEKHNEQGNRLYLQQGYKDKGRHLLTKLV